MVRSHPCPWSPRPTDRSIVPQNRCLCTVSLDSLSVQPEQRRLNSSVQGRLGLADAAGAPSKDTRPKTLFWYPVGLFWPAIRCLAASFGGIARYNGERGPCRSLPWAVKEDIIVRGCSYEGAFRLLATSCCHLPCGGPPPHVGCRRQVATEEPVQTGSTAISFGIGQAPASSIAD